ncbi:MAG TPA: ribosome silencing factor [bacterium]|nr:ribosome silencing factor [bacterium]
MEDRERVAVAIAAAQETKAEDIVLFDMQSRSPITDYVLICSGRSQAHVRGISERIETEMRKVGFRNTSMEGYQEGSWVLMDYDVVLVHVFHPDTRAYYDLESLLQDFPSERIEGEGPSPSPDDDRADSAA